jgi:hypothetical protein
MLHAIASAFIGVAAFISSIFGLSHAPVQAPAEQTLGAALPSGTAVFETSLRSRISSTDTSMTLVSNSVRGGSSLSGYNCFAIDEGRTDAEGRPGFPSASTVGGAGGIAPMWGPTYGDGGAGCYNGGGTCAGSAGAQGIVIVRW